MREIARPSSLYFEERGTGLPIVNLHGWPAEHGQMMAMMEPLFVHRRGWRRIYVDLPGMGLSSGPAGLVSHDQMLDAVSDFIGAVVGDQRVVLAGRSFVRDLPAASWLPVTNRVGAAFLLSPGEAECEPEEAEHADCIRGESAVPSGADGDGREGCRSVPRPKPLRCWTSCAVMRCPVCAQPTMNFSIALALVLTLLTSLSPTARFPVRS